MVTENEWMIQRQISGLNALGHVRELAKIGYRFVGTQGDKASMDYVKGQFKGLGLEVKETPFRTLTFEDEKPLLKILSTGEELEGVVPLFSPSTPEIYKQVGFTVNEAPVIIIRVCYLDFLGMFDVGKINLPNVFVTGIQPFGETAAYTPSVRVQQDSNGSFITVKNRGIFF